MNNMCRFFIVLVLATIAFSHATTSNKLEQGFLKLIEKWKKGDVRSLPIALPTLPLKLAPNKFGMDGYKLSVAEAKIKGLEHLTVTKLAASNSSLTMSLKFKIPTVAVVSDWYRFRGKPFFFFKIDNEGKFRVDINNLEVTATLKFGAQGSNTVIKKLGLHFTVGHLEVNLSGCSGLVLGKVNDRVRQLVNSQSKELMNNIKKQVIEVLNVYLRGHTPQQLMKIISSV